MLKQEPVDRALIFTRTKHGADKVVKGLERAGIRAAAIHGNKSQNHRERVLAAFRSGEVRTLVATDIAARGIDVDGISHVVNFDLPNVPETYVHRIGRTARAGADGIAISLVAGAEELAYLRDIERLIRMALPREDRRTAGHRDAAARSSASTSPGRPAGAAARMRAAHMTVHRQRKALAAAAVVVVIRRAPQINRQEPHRAPRGRRQGRGTAGRGVFASRKPAEPSTQPQPATHTSRPSIWREPWLKKS